ncbi:ATP-binding protein [Xanthovirga aplysinae]|uniref:DNA polymerase III subunit n=1 Tax=Xanthovirga aplysinae TaxID=2529853 RepID=UPI0012BC6D96|nr:DNA polymerase III subunit delta [Xanthovirga aplysinae]MTI30916.1 DNA polymerase III subunit delta [Xanthovirga aplysinae]
MRFADITGLDEEKKYLLGAVQAGHLAHAHLFSGPEGSANLYLALAFATYVNCLQPLENDACGKCASCLKMEKFVHPDFHFAFPVSSTGKITGKDVVSSSYLNDWRNFLSKNPYGTAKDWSMAFGGENKQLNISKEESRHIIKNLSLKAFEGNYKIMLIWLPEYMHVNASNAILKILEEPPEKTLFLLVSNQMEKLLITILSRTQLMYVRAFSDEELVEILINQYQLDETKATQLARTSEGNLSKALSLLEGADHDNQQMFRDWMRLCYSFDLTQLSQWTERFHKLSKAAQQTFLQYGLSLLRDTLLSHYEKGLIRQEGEELKFITNFAKVVSPDRLEKMVNKLSEACYHLERNANPKILFLDLSLQIAKTIKN